MKVNKHQKLNSTIQQEKLNNQFLEAICKFSNLAYSNYETTCMLEICSSHRVPIPELFPQYNSFIK